MNTLTRTAKAEVKQDRDAKLDELEKQYAIQENARDYHAWRMELIKKEILEIQKQKI